MATTVFIKPLSPTGPPSRECPICQRQFWSRIIRQPNCSRTCGGIARRTRKNKRCPTCSKSFFTLNTKQVYCSRNCFGKATQTKKECLCRVCGARFFKNPHAIQKGKGKYCSWPCYCTAMRTQDSVARFWAGADTSGGPNACWLWTRGIRNGYGCTTVLRKSISTHHLAYELTYGPIPQGLHILHSCDVKKCVNPQHLKAGTSAQNAREAAERGLAPRGEQNGNAKLTDAQVRQVWKLRQQGKLHRDIARRFNVSKTTIGRILLGEIWKHIVTHT